RRAADGVCYRGRACTGRRPPAIRNASCVSPPSTSRRASRWASAIASDLQSEAAGGLSLLSWTCMYGKAAAGYPQRVVCLAAEHVETCFALGVGDRVVGVPGTVRYPPEARDRPHVRSEEH